MRKSHDLEQVRNVESALRIGTLYRNSPHPIGRIFQLCAKPGVAVLGTVNYPEPPLSFNSLQIRAYTFPAAQLPRVYCPLDTGISIQLIIFEPPNSVNMQYMSLHPISLALGEKLVQADNDFEPLENISAEEEQERVRVSKLVEKLKLHSVVRYSPSRKEMALPTILNQINCALELAEVLQRNSPLIGPRRKRSMSVSERVVDTAQSLYSFAAFFLWNLFITYAYPPLSRAFIFALVLHRIVAEGILRILEWRPPSRPTAFPDLDNLGTRGLALKDLFATCQQVHIRLQQFSYYPIQYLVLRRRHTTWNSIHSSNSDYIRFYNSLWLVANDVIIGIALGSYITENAHVASAFIGSVLELYTIDGLKRMIRWLMSYPAGLKLNNELAAFLGDLFLWVIEYWSTSMALLVIPYLPAIVYFIGVSSFAGASMPIAILSDLLTMLTLHIYSFYVASARIFNWQLTIIYSLFQLFRGKKRNVLRNRIDNCDYDLDQLLLGTILFTLLFFLLPTVIVFYLAFASARMTIISLQAVLDTCLACLNHFPLFALMLRLKDSKRLPGGIHFALYPSDLDPKASMTNSQRSPTIPSSLFSPFTAYVLGDSSNTLAQPCTTSREAVEVTFDLLRTTPVSTDSSEASQTSLMTSNTSYIALSTTPLSLRQIFAQYFHLASRIRKHYLSPKVVFALMTGRFVPPLGRGEMYGLQYSMLPRQRVSIGEVWRGLTQDEVAYSRTKGREARWQHGGAWGFTGPGSGRRHR